MSIESAPLATYRVQLTPEFGFDDAAAIVPYLAALGVSHLYTSPYLQPTAGSTHGYDVVCHGRLNPELGGDEGHLRLASTLRDQGLGQVVDVVPNHMAITCPDNAWWWDVLQHGQRSPFATYFDIDWQAPEAKLHGKVLMPVLGDQFGRCIEAGEIQIERADDDLRVRYYQQVFPASLASITDLLRRAAETSGMEDLAELSRQLEAAAGMEGPDRGEPGEPGDDRPGQALPVSDPVEQASAPAPPTDLNWPEQAQQLLAKVAALFEDTDAARALDRAIAAVNEDPDAMEQFLRRQCYRLAHWRTAAQELNYRRFFNVNTLIGVRVELPEVFEQVHALVRQWLEAGVVQGLRVDHPDGLRDPVGYFDELREMAPRTWLVIEKILMPDEPLPPNWPVDGTTGYDFLNRMSGLFVDPAGEDPLTDLYHDFTGEPTDYRAVLRQAKQQIVREMFGGELNRLTYILGEICERRRCWRDHTRVELQQAMAALLASFPVYRTYLRPDGEPANEQDARVIETAVGEARRHCPELDGRLFDLLHDILTGRLPGKQERELILRFQQLTGPAMAKSAEDTAFYRYNRLVSLNEVGGEPDHFGTGVQAFHEVCVQAQRQWPRAMLTSSTHDTKRSEDVRARLHLLAEIPDAWAQAVRRWRTMNDPHRRAGWPDRNAEYLLYQTLVGAWPIDAERLTAYMQKAASEAKSYTTWTEPNEKYDQALRHFTEAVLADANFVKDLERFVTPLIEPGRINSLSQTLVKLTAPGVPDIYQGCELWDLSLVDPDNRRPVDFAQRQALLDQLPGLSLEDIWQRQDEGLPKLLVTTRALHLRRQLPEAFGPEADYQPLQASGARAEHVVAFARGGRAITIVPRLVLGLGDQWDDTTLDLPSGRWRNIFTEDVNTNRVELAHLLGQFPVALLALEK